MHWPPPDDWPLSEHSRQVFCHPHRWHVQRMGKGPEIMLLHGAGGSTHSFRDLMPPLARRFTVTAIDLPGQGLTRLGARHRCGLHSMAEDLAALTVQQDWRPVLLVGHSAGGALALRLAGCLPTEPRVLGINAALEQFQGIAGALFPAVARLLALTPFAAKLFSSTTATPDRVRALIASTGSRIPPEGIALYRRLVADPDHVDATLAMMSQWDLEALQRDMPDIGVRTLLLAGERDSTVPPSVSDRAARRLPNATAERLPGLGHLAHEEAPDLFAGRIAEFAGT